MTMTTTLAEVPGLQGAELGTSDWHEVTQEHVNLFADATGDHQWIHVGVERAQAESPFGGPMPNKVRFPAPVPVGSEVRLTAVLKDVEEVAGGLQRTLPAVVEREGGDKPVCIAEPVYRYYGG